MIEHMWCWALKYRSYLQLRRSNNWEREYSLNLGREINLAINFHIWGVDNTAAQARGSRDSFCQWKHDTGSILEVWGLKQHMRTEEEVGRGAEHDKEWEEENETEGEIRTTKHTTSKNRLEFSVKTNSPYGSSQMTTKRWERWREDKGVVLMCLNSSLSNTSAMPCNSWTVYFIPEGFVGSLIMRQRICLLWRRTSSMSVIEGRKWRREGTEN